VNACLLKAFEDLEFRQLEEEAGWLAGRDELQRELTDMASRVEARSLRLRELERQRLEAAQSAQEESCAMERQLLNYLRRLEEVTFIFCLTVFSVTEVLYC
jgi:sensor c-di-GMP phosphodiesterase-like protein